MNEERSTNTIEGIRHRTTKYHPDCPVCDRMAIGQHSTTHNARNEAIAAKAAESLQAIEIKGRLHYDPDTARAIEEIEHFNPKNGILQTWKEIEELINGRN